MGNTVKLGSVNFPKLLRHLGHRTNQVRDLVFIRDPIYRKEVMTTKASSAAGRGSGTTSLSGPAVSFGYEESSFAAQSAGTNAAYHVNSPELVLPGLKGLQSPITSRSGKLERTGHRISGECTFYLPSLNYIKSLREFGKVSQFDELETYDKLIDVERIIAVGADETATSAERLNSAFNIPDSLNNQPGLIGGFEVDRLQAKVKITTGALELIKIQASENSTLNDVSLEWDFRTSAGGSGKVTADGSDTFFSYSTGQAAVDSIAYRTIDLPLMINGREVVVGDKATIYVDGVAHTAVATGSDSDGIMEANNTINVVNSEIQDFEIETDNASSDIFIKDAILYKAAEWRIESIKDFRDEYMEVKAVRVRGNRTSRRRAYG